MRLPNITYDLVGRPLAIKRWQLVESQPAAIIPQNPYGTTTLVYDDTRNAVTITDPFNTTYFARFDGVDRPTQTVGARGRLKK